MIQVFTIQIILSQVLLVYLAILHTPTKFLTCTDESADIKFLMGTDAEALCRSSALFLLKLKEQRRISQVAIDEIVTESKGLFLQCMERVKAGVRAKLAESGVDPNSISGLDSIFIDAPDLFGGIETCHLQEKYYREKLNLIVSIIKGSSMLASYNICLHHVN